MGTAAAGSGPRSQGEWSPDGAYTLHGDVLEAWETTPIATAPGGESLPLRSVAAWRIREGSINKVDVSGQVVVVVVAPPAGAPTGATARVILLEERANPEQALALLDAFRGRLGGPLAELATAITQDHGFAQVPINYQLSSAGASVSVPHRLRLVVRADLAAESSAAALSSHPRCALEMSAWTGRASRISLELPEGDLTWRGSDLPAAYRGFAFSSHLNRLGSKHFSAKEDAMGTTTQEQMDRVLDQHFAAEAAHDLEGVMATFTNDAELDLVGYPAGPRHGPEEIREFYAQLFKLIDQEEARPLYRYYGPDLMVDETLWSGQFDGVLVGAEGRRGPVSFRLLHVLEFREGRVARENVWLDSATIQQQLLSQPR